MSLNFTDFFPTSSLKQALADHLNESQKSKIAEFDEDDWNKICTRLRLQLNDREKKLLDKQLQHDAQSRMTAELICSKKGIEYRPHEWGWKDGMLQRIFLED